MRYLPRIFIFGRPCEQRLSHYVFGVVGCLCDVSVVLGDKINGTLVSSSTSYVISQIPEMSASSFIFCGGGGASVQRFAVTTNFFMDFSSSSNLITECFQKLVGENVLIIFCFRLELDKKYCLKNAHFCSDIKKGNFKISVDR